jgi:DNA-binding SARP family transcriptional activator
LAFAPGGDWMEYRILGPLELWDAGAEVSLGGSRPRALLAAPLLHPNEVVSADRLIDELWGEDSPDHATVTWRSTSRDFARCFRMAC